MRKTKAFKIEGRDYEITVRELTVNEILSLMQDDVLNDTSLDNLRKVFTERFLPLCVSGVTLKDLMDYTPSEIEEVWNHFAEVNNSFFALARKAGVNETIEKLRGAILKDFSLLSVDLSKLDT